MRVTLTERSVLAARLTESLVLAVTLTASGASPARSNTFPQHEKPFSSLESRPCTPLARHLTRSVPPEVLASTPAEFSQHIRDEIERWREVISKMGIRIQG